MDFHSFFDLALAFFAILAIRQFSLSQRKIDPHSATPRITKRMWTFSVNTLPFIFVIVP